MVFFWAFSLMASVYGWMSRPRWRKTFTRVNIAGKLFSVVLPLITICLLQVRAIQEKYIAFLIIADFECKYTLSHAVDTGLTVDSHH